MKTTLWQPQFSLAVALAALMALTRFHHFGSALSLPDASLAVFFFAGLGLSRPMFLGLYLLEAGVIDYLAISQFNVSDYCISPAYWFLIPTYAIMWWAGRHAKLLMPMTLKDSLKIGGLLTLASSIAFTLSNSCFYWFSGRFQDLSWADYIGRTGQYFLPYVASTLLYALFGLGLVKVWRAARKLGHTRVDQL